MGTRRKIQRYRVCKMTYGSSGTTLERFRKRTDTDTDTDMITVSVHVGRASDFVSQNSQ